MMLTVNLYKIDVKLNTIWHVWKKIMIITLLTIKCVAILNPKKKKKKIVLLSTCV